MASPPIRRYARHALSDIDPEPWKNGAGLTRTLACSHPTGSGDAFDWRISVAEIEHGGPFSVFPGIDRIAVVLEHGPLKLSELEVQNEVAPPRILAADLVATAYSGDLALFAHVDGPPIRCLNVMTRRGRTEANVAVMQDGAAVSGAGPILLFAASHAGWQLDCPGTPASLRLTPGDSLFLPDGGDLRATRSSAPGALVAVFLHPLSAG